MKTTTHSKASNTKKKAPPAPKKVAKPTKSSPKTPALAQKEPKRAERSADQLAWEEDYRGTEINDREPRHLYRGATSESTGLPFEELPRHLGVDPEDENELMAGYARVGAGDRGPDTDEEDLEADESRGIEDAGV